MATLKTQRTCKECGRKTLHTRDTFSGGMGCLLTIITAGLFLPVWLVIGAVGLFQPWRCQQCGQGRMI